MTEQTRVTMTWHCYDERATSPLRDTVPLVLIGAVFALIAVALGSPVASVFFFGLMAVPLVLLIKPRIRCSATQSAVIVENQPLSRNRLGWLGVVLFVMGGSFLVQLVLGDEQAWRLAVPGVGSMLAAVLIAVIAVRTRGALMVSTSGITLNGRDFSYDQYGVSVWVPVRGALGIQLKARERGQARGKPTYITYGMYGLDANTFVSAVEQIQQWSRTGRTATAAEIAAMLTVSPPTGVTTGDSMSVVVDVAASDSAR